MLAEVLALFIRVEWQQHQGEILAEGADISSFMPLASKFLREIRAGFWNTRVWRRRQSFAKMLAALAAKRLITVGQFLRLMFHDFMDVSRDGITHMITSFCLYNIGPFRGDQRSAVLLRSQCKPATKQADHCGRPQQSQGHFDGAGSDNRTTRADGR
jgi:hypothetical protein